MGDSTAHDIRFSVVIPAYNAAQTIERTLRSVLSQSYPPYEVIVVDDASTDGTETLLSNYPGIRYIRKIGNSGSSATRNKGMDAATGDYCAFLDADDMWHPDKLMLVNTVLSNQPGITLFYHKYTTEDILHKKLPENITVYKLPFVKLLPANVVSTSCLVLRNSKEYRFEESMRYAEDYDLALRIGYKHKLYFVDIPLTQINRAITSRGGISGNRWKMRLGEMKAYRRLTKLHPLFVALLPFLLVSSLGKHVYKLIKPV